MLPSHKVEQYKEVVEQSPMLKIMKELLEANEQKWNNELVNKHNEAMMELLEKELKAKNEYIKPFNSMFEMMR